MRSLLLLLTVSVALVAQTVVNGSRTISGAWDASGAASTKPVKAGTSLPGTCAVGEVFFKTDAANGKNLRLCTAPNTWTDVRVDIDAHLSNTSNPHSVTAAQVGAMAAVTGSGVVKVTAGTPGLVSGSASDCVKVDGSSGACGTGGSATAPLALTGTSDAVQLDVKGYSTQTNPILRVRKFDDTVTFQVNGDGTVEMGAGNGPWDLSNQTAPATPSAGISYLWADSTGKNLRLKDDTGRVTGTVVTTTCSGARYMRGFNTDGTPICEDPGSGGIFDASRFQILEEFPCTATSQYTHPWISTAISSGLGATCPNPYYIFMNRTPGHIRIGSNGTSGQGGSIAMMQGGLYNMKNAAAGRYGSWTMEWYVAPSDGVTVGIFGARVGLSGSYNTVDPTDFVGMRWIGGTDTSYIQFEVREASVSTLQATTVPMVAGELYKFRMSNPGDNTITFSVTNVWDAGCPAACPTYSWTHTGTAPTGLMYPLALAWQTGTGSAQHLYLDRFAFEITGLTSR